MHEDTVQTERTQVHEAHRVEKLLVLLIVSMGLSLAARAQPKSSRFAQADRGSQNRAHVDPKHLPDAYKVAEGSVPIRSARRQSTLAKPARANRAAHTRRSRQIEQPLEQPWPRGSKLGCWVAR